MAGEPQNKPTVSAIAQELGISKTTVSRALSGKGRVSADTRQRVQQYLEQSGCAADALGRPARRVTHNIALVIPNQFIQLDLPFLRKCMGGVARMADQRGYDVLLCYCGRDDNSSAQLRRQLSNHKIDGVILSRTVTEDPCLALLKQYHTPFVAIGRTKEEDVIQIDNDQVGASYEMTRLLLQSGMRRIAYLGGSSAYTVNVDRMSGYLRALAEAGVSPEKGLIWNGVESQEQREDALDGVLEQRPDCLLCSDDHLAFQVFFSLRDRGIRVPQQLRLASLYDSELLRAVSPTVSAVQFDAQALGSTACRLLLDQLAGKDVPRRQIQGYQVILRESTK